MDEHKKQELKNLAKEILCRVEVARSGFHNSTYWNDPDDNLGAPDGMSYDDWIEQAEKDLLSALDSV